MLQKQDIEKAAENGIGFYTLRSRLSYGMSVEEAVVRPVWKKFNAWGTWKEVAVENGISCSTFYNRLRRGWDEERSARERVGRNR